MAEQTKTQAPSEAQEAVQAEGRTQEQLITAMQKATAANDWKLVSKVASEIAKTVATEERAVLEAKQKAAAALGMKVKTAIDKLIKTMIDKEELDEAEGVWYSMDFGDAMISGQRPSGIRLLKSAVKAAKGRGGGGGKKYDVRTEDMLKEHGSKVMNTESGQTYQQAYDASTDGNSRYQVRVKLLKLAGIS